MESENRETNLAFEEDIVRNFVGENSDYYIAKWLKSKDPAKRWSWNWSPFLAGWFWLGYRKMYSTLWQIFGVFVVLDIVEIFFGLHSMSSSFGTTVGVIMGMFGNALYYNHMKNKITNIQNNYKSIEEQKLEIEKAGGTSWLGVGIVLLVVLLYVILLEFIEPLIKGI